MKLLGDAGNQEILESNIDEEMNRILSSMEDEDDADKYAAMMDNLVKLSNVKSSTAKSRRGIFGIDSNTAAQCLTSIASVAFIVVYEQRHVFASKAMSFIKRV